MVSKVGLQCVHSPILRGQLMTLDIVEGHFSGGHAKVIGAEEKYW